MSSVPRHLPSQEDKGEEVKTARYLCIDKTVQTVVEKHGHQIDIRPQCGKFVGPSYEGENHTNYPSREISANTVIDLIQMKVLLLPVHRAGRTSRGWQNWAPTPSATVCISTRRLIWSRFTTRLWTPWLTATRTRGIVFKIKAEERWSRKLGAQ